MKIKSNYYFINDRKDIPPIIRGRIKPTYSVFYLASDLYSVYDDEFKLIDLIDALVRSNDPLRIITTCDFQGGTFMKLICKSFMMYRGDDNTKMTVNGHTTIGPHPDFQFKSTENIEYIFDGFLLKEVKIHLDDEVRVAEFMLANSLS